ncbi:MAG TPA: sigma-70 family RNA polymerase sigma factor, partial [Mycobacterium sp.]|nr:sigma-70 family RNA polymerase sigma factor [Mycobacterium sp.]
MTAVPTWDVTGPTDAELARAAAGGDRTAFADIYDRYADRLHDYCIGMLRDRDGAADCVQDAFCTAATKLSQLREPDKLRPWLYAIARNEALRRLQQRRRETPSDDVPDMVSHEPGPDTLAARTELADLIGEAAGGLSDRDRSVLELAYRHGLDGPELAKALGVTPGTANRIVHRLRETIERSLGALLVSRRAQTAAYACPELTAVLDGWDGNFTLLMRKRIARHIESCATCDGERRQLVSPAALLGVTPVFIPAPAWLRERTLDDVRLDPVTTPLTEDVAAENGSGSIDSGPVHNAGAIAPHADAARRDRRRLLPVALIGAALVGALGLTIVGLHQQNSPITPVEMSGTAPQPPSPEATPELSPINVPPTPPTTTHTTTLPALTTPPDSAPPEVR